MGFKSQTKMLSRQIGIYLTISCLIFNFHIGAALAGPSGHDVQYGNVTVHYNGNNTIVKITSNKAIINWASLNTLPHEVLQFLQQSSNSAVLNRIMSGSATQFNGTLLANGRVFIVNPAGVYFGNGAKINVNQLVASSLNISNADFINGQYNFAGGTGSVINSGDITAEKVYLIGKQVANYGNISCPSGFVVMASGDRVFLGEVGSDVVVEIDVPSLPQPAGHIEGSAILNEGIVEVGDGAIILAAAGDIYSQAISNVGTLAASSDIGDAGQVKLTAPEGTVISSGTIEAKSTSGTGGTVQVLGDKVGLFGAAEIDVSGSAGGGTVLVGGDYQGGGDVPTASRTYIGPEATIKADATDNGDGGKVIVWSDEVTRYYGDISARGGANGGDGGFAEVSGHSLIYRGHSDLGAPLGSAGTLLLDPATITITGGTLDGSDDELGNSTALLDDGGIPGQVAFGAAISPFTVYESEIEGTDADIVLQATDGITVIGAFNTITNGEAAGQVRLKDNRSLTMDTRNAAAEGSTGIDLTGGGLVTVEFQTQGTGSITVRAGVTGGGAGGDAGTASVTVGKLTTLGSGSITLRAEGGVAVSGDLTTAASTTTGTPSGNITLTADTGAILLNNNLTTGSATVADAGGNQTATSGNIALTAATGISGVGVSTTGNASITGADAGGIDTATSGNITLNVTGAGDVGLSGANALTIGTATGNAATTLTATTGNITVTSADRVNKGIASTAMDISFGAATGGSTNTAGKFAATTDGGAGALGEIWITSGEALDVGVLDTAGTAQNISIVTTAGNLTWSGASLLDTDTVVFDGAGVLTVSADQTLGSFTGTGASIVIGDNAGAGDIVTTASATSGTASGNISLTADTSTILLNDNLTTGNATVADAAGITTATSGNIALQAVTGITGDGVVKTGNASVDATTPGAIDTAKSGNITLNVTGAGSVGLNGVNALTIGTATVTNNTTNDTATTGNITVTTADRVNNGTASTAMDISFGAATGGQTNTAGKFAATTDGLAGAAGEIWITSGEALDVGALNTADGTAQNISIITTGNAALRWSGASLLDTDVVVFGGATTGALTIDAAQTLGSFTGNSAAGITINNNITATIFITANSGTDGTGDVGFGAGVTLDAPAITLRAGNGTGAPTAAAVDFVTNTPLAGASNTAFTIRQDAAIGAAADPLAHAQFNGGVAAVDLTLQSDDSTVALRTAGGWKSVTATSAGNLTLTNLTNNDAITVGNLTSGGEIWVQSVASLSTPATAAITANGAYGAGDDRAKINFLATSTGDKDAGDPFDMAVYLASTDGDVTVNSGVTIAANGTMVIDAKNKVTFGSTFEASTFGPTTRLEVCSRTTESLNQAGTNGYLPYDELGQGGIPSWFGGKAYVLRGGEPDAWVLDLVKSVPLPPLLPPIAFLFRLEDLFEMAGVDPLQWLAEELGEEAVQTYLEDAYDDLYSTDLRPYRVAEVAAKLMNLAAILKDADNTRRLALAAVVGEFVKEPPPSEEQMASIKAALLQHRGDGTRYDKAREWLDALAAYVDILNTEIGWSSERSIEFVMGKYGSELDTTTAMFVQMYLQSLGSEK